MSHFKCYRCGDFRSDHYALGTLKRADWSEQQIANASSYVRRNGDILLTSDEVERLSTLETPTVGEKLAQLLTYFGREYPQPGESFMAPVFEVQNALSSAKTLDVPDADFYLYDNTDIDLGSHSQLPALKWLAIASASNAGELYWLIFDCLLMQGFLSKGRSDGQLTIAPKGWNEIDRLKRINAASRFGFVAMSFRDRFTALYEQGIAPGISAAGYEARRVDRTEHNNRIDDETIAGIKQSRFLIADFTVNRGGIYFEAGLAIGLGLPVIWLVRENRLEGVHFDNRQYNFITWREGEWNTVIERFRFRIEATIGRGPLKDHKLTNS
jgi:nucleoside 2-deoxyribosyltransferase